MGSAPPTFAIPLQYQSELRSVEPLDSRSDADIIASLKNFTPVTSERNVWAFWHSGVDGMPAYCRRNVISWFRINGPSWTVRVLDADPSSPNYLLNYIPAAMLPEAILTNGMTGPFSGQHTADFTRSAVIYLHGGCFLDVGIILIRRLDRICWDKLADEASPFQLAIPTGGAQHVANHFVACRKDDPFIRRWHELMLHMWKGKTDCTGVILNSPLSAVALENDDPTTREPFGWDFADFEKTLEYVGQILAFSRMCLLDKEDEEGFNCAEYWGKHCLSVNQSEEAFAAEVMMKRVGPHPRIMELLATRRDANPESQDWKEASVMTWRMLTKSSYMKVTSATGLCITPHLGVLWNMPENLGKDCVPGTFAELLRYGAEHYEQTREEIAYHEPKKLDKCVNKTLLEE